MDRGTIVAVSYLNTVPFIYGIEHAAGLRGDLVLSPPRQCAERFFSGKADIALIPVQAAAGLDPSQIQIITPYCLGASGSVRTVVLVSNSPLEEIRRIYLDSHSLTSVRLVRILAGRLWNIAPRWEELDDYSVVDNPAPGDAFLLIGDKVFGYEGRFAYSADLADEWRRLTSLPFVFAVWVAHKGIDPQLVAKLEEALSYGLRHIPEAIEHYGHGGKPYALDYLTRNIDYLFDEQKRRALSLFREEGMKFDPRANPG